MRCANDEVRVFMTTVHVLHKNSSEKRSAALSSVVAAVGLTGIKLVVGLVTGSLGILAEAAHSALDLIAALMTFFAVKVSDKPADSSHLYGHGKVESLSAMLETLLLLVTCIWIVYEAINRLFFNPIEVRVTYWAFLVMGISIVVDFSRARMLSKTAKKYKSQALEADALHFSTDIWSSVVVIIGLICVEISRVKPSLAFLHEADAVTALIVAAIVIYIGIRLGIRTIHALIDAAPKGAREQISSAVSAMTEVKNCHKVRIRSSGANYFVDVHVLIDGNKSLREAHKLTEDIEHTIRKILPGADVTVHPEPD